MLEIEATYATWGEVNQEVFFNNSIFSTLTMALKDFEEEKILRIKVPYGTTLIDEGVFQWDLLKGFEDLKAGYGDAPIPMGLVISKVMELFAPVPKQTHRNLPIYIVPEGRFFGLFETYAPARVQSKLWGSAGASTLLVLPRIGNITTLTKFGKSIGCTFSSELLDGLKSTHESSLAFGRFFEALLHETKSPWRMEFAIFPRAFVDKLEEHWPAYGALRQLTLDQLAMAHSRVETTLEMLEFHAKPQDVDALAVRQVARGYRPGFVPVFGTADDERLLPAAELHELLYRAETGLFINLCGNVCGNGQSSLDFYPAIFRPSLPSENSYYFFKRPYGPDVDLTISSRLANVKAAIERIDRHNRMKGINRVETKLYSLLKSADFQAMVEQQFRTAGVSAVRSVCIGSSLFVEGGVVHVTRMPNKKA